jgi:hypothetical protein
MSSISTNEKQEILGEILILLGEQDRSLREILATGDQRDYTLRASRINDLLEELRERGQSAHVDFNGNASRRGSVTTSPNRIALAPNTA